MATAIGEVPSYSPLSTMLNVVVFSAEGTLLYLVNVNRNLCEPTGDRPLSSMLGGGDLDVSSHIFLECYLLKHIP